MVKVTPASLGHDFGIQDAALLQVDVDEEPIPFAETESWEQNHPFFLACRIFLGTSSGYKACIPTPVIQFHSNRRNYRFFLAFWSI